MTINLINTNVTTINIGVVNIKTINIATINIKTINIRTWNIIAHFENCNRSTRRFRYLRPDLGKQDKSALIFLLSREFPFHPRRFSSVAILIRPEIFYSNWKKKE